MEVLQPGGSYHIYNRGINGCNLFLDDADYLHFLRLYGKYMLPVADTFSYVLMPNHFHFVIRVREDLVYRYTRGEWTGVNGSDSGWNDVKWLTRPVDAVGDKDRKIPSVTFHVSHLFDAYVKYFNARHDRHGSLLERNFKRNVVADEDYLRNLIIYVNQNPVKHGFVSQPAQYRWSSFVGLVTGSGAFTVNDEVVRLFGDVDNLKFNLQSYRNFNW